MVRAFRGRGDADDHHRGVTSDERKESDDMKKFFSLMICRAFVIGILAPVCGAVDIREKNCVETVFVQELDDGITVTQTIREEVALRAASTKTVTNQKEYKRGNDVIAVIAVTGTFRYDGSTSSVVSKRVSRSDTYSGWSFTQRTFSSSGSTIVLSGSVSKLSYPTLGVDLKLSCNKNGEVSF